MSKPIVNAEGLSKVYGIHQVFTGVTLTLKAGEKAALVGPNGIGKSTLLKILAGRESADTGIVTQLQKPLSCHYVPQMPVFGASSALGILEETMNRLGLATAGIPREALCRFGFSDQEIELAADLLSGGQKTRLALAVAWMVKPDLLLLDEPTNHLDLGALRQLEGFVRDYPGSVLVVSHDRMFLDNVISRVLELKRDGLVEYTGNYTAYQRIKANALVKQMATYKATERRMGRLEEAIAQQMRHFHRSHQKAGQHDFYRSKAKKLAQAGKAQRRRLESMRVSLEPRPRIEKSIASLDFEVQSTGRRLVMAKDLGKIYDRTLFTGGDFSILRGDKVALIGSNGSGKTTLLKMILGWEVPSQGRLWVSPSVSMGYLDQELQQLRGDGTVLEETLSVLARETQGEITRVRTLLAGLLFAASDLEKSVQSLSVGERKRVAMAKLLLGNYNLLLMDEPTDHLDLSTRERLEEALDRYDGTLVLISHDRYLLSKVTNKVIALEDGRVISYEGGFQEYADRKKGQAKGREKPALTDDERLLLETRLAKLGFDLAVLTKGGAAYAETEQEYLEIASRLKV